MSSLTISPLILLPAEPSDAVEIFEMHLASFSSPPEPFFFVIYPEEEPREKAVKRMTDRWLGDPTARYMKVVDVNSGKIISAGKWCIYESPLTEAQMNEQLHFDWLSDADSNEWGEYVYDYIHRDRLARTKGGVCCVLDMLSTHPDHQYRGAGSMLVKWGTDIADSMGVKAFIEGTVAAKKLYESHGFVASEDWIIVPVEEKWKNRPVIRHFAYERPAMSGVVREGQEEGH